MVGEGDRNDLSPPFHFMNNESDDREVKPAGGGIEVEREFGGRAGAEMELEAAQIDDDRMACLSGHGNLRINPFRGKNGASYFL